MKRMNKIMPNSVCIIFFAILFIGNISYGQSKADKIDELITKYAEYGKFNGSILVVEKGEIIYKKGFGWANMEWDMPNQTDTKFRLASVTKQFTAMLIVQLAAENKLQLDLPISTYLKDYPKENGDVITIHHLLTHTSGTPNFTSFRSYRKIENDAHRPKDIAKIFADSTLNFTPGEKFEYSNSGYTLLGMIIEQVTGKSYEQVLQDKIFTPLKMNNTGYDHNTSILKNRATGYDKMGTKYQITRYIDMSVPYSAGSMYSTVEDLFLWDQALYTETLLPKKYMDLVFEKHIPDYNRHYGYGWGIGELRIGNSKDKLPSVGHGGGINGFNTLITRIPSDKSSIIILNNTGGAPLNAMTASICGILYNMPYDFPKKSLAQAIQEKIEMDGLNEGLLFYKTAKDSSDYKLDENEMNMTGYHFLQSDRTKEAAAIFKLNVDAFPNSFNVYDSYGEVLLQLGQKKEGIENYKKSIELNPRNQNGIDVLKGLGVSIDNLIIKAPLEFLELLEGEYIAINKPVSMSKDWKITFDVDKGILYGNDQGYRYELVSSAQGKFINPDDGASLVFDTEDKNAITLLLFEKYKFKKVK